MWSNKIIKEKEGLSAGGAYTRGSLYAEKYGTSLFPQ